MISKKMKYALKALVALSSTEEPSLSAVKIAQNTNVPLKFLEQILNELKKGAIINSKKGSSGGYYFVKKPENITVADVYRLIDGPIAWISCVSLNFYESCLDCENEKTCSIHHAFAYLRDEMLSVLQKMTITDLAENKYGTNFIS